MPSLKSAVSQWRYCAFIVSSIFLSGFGASLFGPSGPNQAALSNGTPIHAPTVGHSQAAKLADAYGKLPLSFEANHGQSDRRVKFLSRGSSYALFFTSNELVVALPNGNQSKDQSQVAWQYPERHSSSGRTDLLWMRLIGVNPDVRVSGVDELPGKANYFVGNQRAKWQTNVPTYAKVKYEQVYRGVDLIYYGNQRRLEYDFVVAPGADPKAIRLSFRSAKSLALDERGALVFGTERADLRFEPPGIYQEVEGKRRTVEGQYVLKGGSTVGFEIGNYDRAKPLLIDPVLVYSTYLGGSNQGSAIAVDSSGNAYVTGYTYSSDFPTVNALQTSLAGVTDAFITKIDASGSALVYSTYLGGPAHSAASAGSAIAVDSSGNAYVTGSTTSSSFPLVNAIQLSYGGGLDYGDAFAAEIAASGSALVYSTYLGGAGDDYGTGIAVDSSSNTYVAGTTASSNFPTAGPLQASFGGGVNFGDAFVSKIGPGGSTLVYSTYLGGSSEDFGSGIAIDSSGNAYVTGSTASTNFPLMNALQSTPPHPPDIHGRLFYNAFVTKIDASGSALVYSTYLGGSNTALASGIAVDSSGDAYVTGYTQGDFPTVNALQPNFSGVLAPDAFVSKINTAGSALIYSTYLGGSDYDAALAIAVDSSGNAYVTGETNSSDFPAINPLQPCFGTALGGSLFDVFIAKINAPGSALAYSTCLGGSYSDIGLGIAVDSSGNAYVTGSTGSTNFPTVNPEQSAGGGAFIAKLLPVIDLSPGALVFAGQPVGTASTAQTITLNNETNAILAISSMGIGGVNGSDFAETDNCDRGIAAAASCRIQVVFAPKATGTRTGALTVTYNANNPSPQTVVLSGVGQDFSLAPSSQSAVTVTRGQSGSLGLTVAPISGFTQTVTFSCSGAPAQSACTASPGSVALNGSSAAAVTVTVATIAASAATPASLRNMPPVNAAYWFLFAGLLSWALAAMRPRQRPRLVYGGAPFLFVCALLMVGCGSSSGTSGSGGASGSGGSSSGNAGTPAGNYTLTVTGTSGTGSTTISHSINLTLIVQ